MTTNGTFAFKTAVWATNVFKRIALESTPILGERLESHVGAGAPR
jgi:hypothetical protein